MNTSATSSKTQEKNKIEEHQPIQQTSQQEPQQAQQLAPHQPIEQLSQQESQQPPGHAPEQQQQDLVRVETPNLTVELSNDSEDDDSELNEEIEIDDTGNVISEAPLNKFSNTTPLGIVFQAYGLDIYDNLLSDFEKLDIKMRNLSSLSNEDLELLGIRDAHIREKMLNDFAVLPNQENNLNSSKQEIDPFKYNQIVLANVYNHLTNLKSALSAVLLKIHVKPVENVLIDKRRYASSLVLRTLDEFHKTLVSMEKSLKDLCPPPETPIEPKKTNYSNYVWKCLVVGMITTGGTLMFMKYFKNRSI